MVPDAARSCWQGSATVLCGKNRKTLHWRENMRTYQNIWEQYGSKVPSVVSSKWRQHGDPSLSAYLTNFNKASGCKSVSPRSAKLGGQKKQTWSRNEVLESSELHYKVSHLVHQLGLGSSHLWASEFSLLHLATPQPKHLHALQINAKERTACKMECARATAQLSHANFACSGWAGSGTGNNLPLSLKNN